jgi:hypothetical protein
MQRSYRQFYISAICVYDNHGYFIQHDNSLLFFVYKNCPVKNIDTINLSLIKKQSYMINSKMKDLNV